MTFASEQTISLVQQEYVTTYCNCFSHTNKRLTRLFGFSRYRVIEMFWFHLLPKHIAVEILRSKILKLPLQQQGFVQKLRRIPKICSVFVLKTKFREGGTGGLVHCIALPTSNQIQLVTLRPTQLTQASFLQKYQMLQNGFLISVMLRWHSGVKNHEIWTFKVNFLCQKTSESF